MTAAGGPSAVIRALPRPDRRPVYRAEQNALRAPVFAPRPLTQQLALAWPELRVHRAPFSILELAADGATTTDGLVVFVHLTSKWLALRPPPSDGRVPVSLTEVARWLGASKVGGAQRRAASACLRQLRGATFRSTIRYPDHPRMGSKADHVWGLVEECMLPTGPGRGQGWVRLSAFIVWALERDGAVLLDRATLDALQRAGPVPTRLWCYLESEAFPHPFNLPIFAAALHEPAPERAMPAIADMLRLEADRRRNTVQRIRRACLAIMAADSRYELAVIAAGAPGQWYLRVARHRRGAVEADPGIGHSVDANRAFGMTPEPLNRAFGVTVDPSADDARGTPNVLGNRAFGMTPGEGRRHSLTVSSYRSSRARARGRDADNQDDDGERDAIARARARLDDPTASADVRQAAAFQLDRLRRGAP